MQLSDGLNELARRLRMLFSRQARFNAELEVEMRLHRELRAQELQNEGMDAEEARYAAQRRLTLLHAYAQFYGLPALAA